MQVLLPAGLADVHPLLLQARRGHLRRLGLLHAVAQLHRPRGQGPACVPGLRHGAAHRGVVLGAQQPDGEVAGGAGREAQAPRHGALGPPGRRRGGRGAPRLRGRHGRRPCRGRGAWVAWRPPRGPCLRHAGRQGGAGARLPHPRARDVLGPRAPGLDRGGVCEPVGEVASAAVPHGEGALGRPPPRPRGRGPAGRPRHTGRHRQLLVRPRFAELPQRPQVRGLLARLVGGEAGRQR
mmetsp:Transcript_121112/g.339133  ORF Transcript_121112/g.339133 Transcript_121112/m.339133 type:complete len:237 (-) Transcript_121112:2669-3379(-)